jgi:hypothetical protein
MTEKQWLACTDPQKMLGFLKGKAGERKLRLFAVACSRRVWHHLTDETLRQGIRLAERYADGLATKDELVRAIAAITTACGDQKGVLRLHEAPPATNAAFYAVSPPLVPGKDILPARLAAINAATDAGEVARQTDLLRDIFRPFHPISGSPAWQTPQVVALAQAAYDERDLPAGTLDLARLAILADALEYAGCDQADLLGHLRGPGPHVRGCWAVDLLLGKE